MPAKTYFRINIDKIIKLLNQEDKNLTDKFVENPQTSLGEFHKQDSGNSTNKIVEIPQTIHNNNKNNNKKNNNNKEDTPPIKKENFKNLLKERINFLKEKVKQKKTETLNTSKIQSKKEINLPLVNRKMDKNTKEKDNDIKEKDNKEKSLMAKPSSYEELIKK